MAVDLNPIPGYNKDGEDSVWAFRNSQSGVKQLLAGSGITLSPASGLGAVTVTSSGGGGSGTVTSVTAGSSNIVIGGTPTVAPTVDLSANPSVTSLTSSGLTLNPGASTLVPFLTGGRNYLDINAPAAIGGTPGALRLLANNGAKLSVVDNINLNVPTTAYITIEIIGITSYLQLQPNSSGGHVLLNAAGNLYLAGGSFTQVAGGFNRVLSATSVAQPVIQYGTATGSGATGTAVVTIPTAYTSTTSYVVQVTMQDSPTAQLYATPTAANKFDIGWTSAGVGTQNIMWTTFGT